MESLSTQTPAYMDSSLHSARWYHAVTLEERVAAFHHEEQSFKSDEPIISEQARKKFQRWKEQGPFEKGTFFAERLAMDGITEQDLLTLLAEPVEALQQRMARTSPPDWLAELVHCLEADACMAALADLFEEAEEIPGAYALLQPFYPLLLSSMEHFQAEITALSAQYEHLPFDSGTILFLLLPNLAQQMMPKLSRAVVLELNIARLRGQLQGDTAQERFRSYLQHLSRRENLQAFLEEYCILARQLMITVELWVHTHLELIRRLCADWEQILHTFAPEQEPGALTVVAGGAGDTHRKGHSVMLLTFHSGWQLVYKPRSLSIDIHFQELLGWLNARGQHPAFRTLNILEKKTYGWVEFVHDATCASEEEIRWFYERQGSYLALLYVLDAVDFHAENVIAAGEHPVLVDLEALFHPRVKAEDGADLERPAQDVLAHSVLQLFLLPQRVWSNDEFEGIDISGLGKTKGQMSPHAVPQWESAGTDEMKLVRERVKMGGNKNCPTLRGQDVQALDYLQSIMTGFTGMYQLLVKSRNELASEMLPRFAHDEVRFIARPTRAYALLLNESFHPNILRDALKRERFFDRLWIAGEHQSSLKRLIPAERADLFRGDIPLFTASPESCDLFTSQGECLPGFFAEPSLNVVRARVSELGEEDMRRQLWMIRAAFTSVQMKVNGGGSGSDRHTVGYLEVPATLNGQKLVNAQKSVSEQKSVNGEKAGVVSRERFLIEACAIGERLCEMALQNEKGADWIGLAFVKEREWSIMPAGIDLYSGLPGMLLFLSYLGEVTGEERYTTHAIAALKTLRAMIGRLRESGEHFSIGAWNGIGSCIYLYAHLAALWNDAALVQEAEELVQLLPAWIAKDEQFDLVDGAAGCIGSLLSLYAVSPSSSTLALAIQCGEHLLANAQTMPHGSGWKASGQEVPLTGFAHGAAGIAWSLLKLAAVSGEARFRQAADEALAYERSLFSQEKRNWPDLRTSPQMRQERQPGEQTPRYGMSWSHGAPGIALARLASPGAMDDEITRREIESALGMILEAGIGYHHTYIGPNHSLAHGDLGNLEAVLVATQMLALPHLQAARDQLAGQVLANMNQWRWVMGVPLNVETPGFMVGLAGIGYELLRLAEPEKVPSVLMLAAPVG